MVYFADFFGWVIFAFFGGVVWGGLATGVGWRGVWGVGCGVVRARGPESGSQAAGLSIYARKVGAAGRRVGCCSGAVLPCRRGPGTAGGGAAEQRPRALAGAAALGRLLMTSGQEAELGPAVPPTCRRLERRWLVEAVGQVAAKDGHAHGRAGVADQRVGRRALGTRRCARGQPLEVEGECHG